MENLVNAVLNTKQWRHAGVQRAAFKHGKRTARAWQHRFELVPTAYRQETAAVKKLTTLAARHQASVRHEGTGSGIAYVTHLAQGEKSTFDINLFRRPPTKPQ